MARPIGSTNGRTPDGGYPKVSNALASFLAGFLAGEASFQIGKQPGRNHHRCLVSVTARDDDSGLLRLFARETALGTVRSSAARGNAHPQAHWIIAAKADCSRLTAILDAHPLRGRKSREYELWRTAVNWWVGKDPTVTHVGRDWTVMAELKRQLHEAKAFDAEYAPPTLDSAKGLAGGWAAFLAGYLTAEGSLGINRTAAGFRPVLQIRVRQDDGRLLEQLRNRTGCGRLYFEKRPVADRSLAVNWVVFRSIELLRIVDVFDKHPPLGRKRGEYDVWRSAVVAYASDLPRKTVRTKLASLRDDLARVRRYRPPAQAQSAA